jgi:formylglycine-generating enzyme required for sulfatase activity
VEYHPRDVIEDRLNLVGVTLENKYRIDAIVAEGGFALVYKAMHLAWNRPVAIKAFFALADLPESQRGALVAEFLREGALLAELSERNAAIVQARDVGTLDAPGGERVPYMILEWLDGATLESVLHDEREKNLPLRTPEEAVALLEPIAEALELAHRKGIAHRDVKPPNIFILGDARAARCAMKLLDFGIAKVVQDAQKMSGSFNKTSGSVTSFTPAYGAPEQFSRTHGATGPWTDVFALALVASEVMSGREPLSGDSFVQLGFAAADPARRPTPRTLGANVSDEVEGVFAKALAVKPDDRYATAGEFWNALRSALAMSPMRLADNAAPSTPKLADPTAFAATAMAPATTSPVASTQSPPPRRKGLVAALGVVVVAAIGGGIFVATRAKAPHDAMTADTSSASASTSPSAAPVSSASMRACPRGAVAIDGGQFFMGTNDTPSGKPYLANEKPAHPVKLSPFCIDVHEVTVAQYVACSNDGKCLRANTTNDPPLGKAYDAVCNQNDVTGRAKHPINCVDWDQAQRYCTEHDGRLPTEAEWELAARGRDGRLYPWGDAPPDATRANACGTECIAWAKKNGVLADFPQPMYAADDGFATTAPVGSFPAGKSLSGVEDVVGNVAEWTADRYGPYTTDVATTVNDPKGASSGDARVIRGGAWNASFPEWARPTLRFSQSQSSRNYAIGFRCAYSR